MEENNKRFYGLIALLAFLWLTSIFILSYAANGIREDHQEIQKLSQAIEDLQNEPFPPDEEYLEKLEQQNRLLTQRLKELTAALHYEEQEVAPRGSVAFFYSNCRQRVEKIIRQARQRGIKLKEDTPLFPNPNSDSELQGVHWTAMDIGSRLLPFLIELSSSESCLYSISRVVYPDLKNWPSEELFIRELDVTLSFESEFDFLMEVIALCSRPAAVSRRYLFTMDEEGQKLNEAVITPELHKKFEKNHSSLSASATVETEIPGIKWLIRDMESRRVYYVVREGNELHIYDQSTLAFLKVDYLDLKKDTGKPGGPVVTTLTLTAFKINPQGRPEGLEATSPSTGAQWDDAWKHRPAWDDY